MTFSTGRLPSFGRFFMDEPVLVLRPEPGAARTMERLRALRFRPIAYPLFAVEPFDWTPPDPAGFDAVLLTSANALRHGGPGLSRYFAHPAIAVGEATAVAARQAGFRAVEVGGGDIASTMPVLARAGYQHILHPGGQERRGVDAHGLSITVVPVYRSVPLGDKEGLARALPRDAAAFALIHSPRAGARFAELTTTEQRCRIAIVAISIAASDACETGWRERVAAGQPTEAALLAGLQMLV